MAHNNKEHRRAYMKEYYEANKEQLQEYQKTYQKAYYEANREQRLVYMKAWREANRDKHRAYQKKYHKAHYKSNKLKTVALNTQTTLNEVLALHALPPVADGGKAIILVSLKYREVK